MRDLLRNSEYLSEEWGVFKAVPDELVTKENIKSVRLLPLIFLMMVMNFFRIKGANKHFIHTQKGINGK